MATQQYITQSVLHNQTLEDGKDDWNSSSASSEISSSNGFDCNICLDTVRDPVVTICGHLYCWPCIYEWIHQQTVSTESLDHQPRCPVCKAEISEKTLIPLYGRGESLTGSDPKSASLGLVIPDRPRRPPCGAHTLIATSTTRTSQHPALRHDYRPSPAQEAAYYSYTSAPGIGLAGNSTFYPIINMFGEMIYTRLFGDSGSFYTYPVSYGIASMRGARARRQTLHADQSLSRLCFFLCCCVVLCLLLF